MILAGWPRSETMCSTVPEAACGMGIAVQQA